MPCIIYKLDVQEKILNLVRYVYFKCSHVKSESVWYLPFQEEHLSMGWGGNLDSSMVKNARLVIWRSVVQIPVRVQNSSLENIICKLKLHSLLGQRIEIIAYSAFYTYRLVYICTYVMKKCFFCSSFI